MKLNRKKMLSFGIIFTISICAAAYYYGLHLSFWPDPEFTAFPLRYYYETRLGYKFARFGIGFQESLAYLAYLWLGVGFKGIRLFAALMYFFIIFCTAILALYLEREKKFRWYALPLFIYLAVLLNPGSSVTCGHHTLAYHVYPYDMHTEPVFLCLFLLVFVQRVLAVELNQRRWWIIFLSSFIIVIMPKVDLIFKMGFVAPVICTVLAGQIRKDRRIIKLLSLIGALFIFTLRCLSLLDESFKRFFSVQTLYYGSWANGITHVYGDAGFTDLQNIWSNISNVVTELLALFNVELKGSLLSIHMVGNLLRIVLILIILIIVAKQIKASFCKDRDECDYISIISSYGIVFNIIAVVITYYGSDLSCIRYMTLITFLGTVLLCRQIESVCIVIFGKQKDNRLYLFIYFAICCLIDFRPVWRADSFQMDYEYCLEEVAEIIMENSLGTGIGSHWCASILTSLMEGKYAVIDKDLDYDKLIKETQINYLVEGSGENLEAAEYFKSTDLEYFFEINGEPDRVWKTDAFVIYYYENGLIY